MNDSVQSVRYSDDQPVDAIDEQLVAYLDGELPPDDVRELERRLGGDSILRQRLRELQNGWELLDELPQPASSGALLETTIRMAAVDGGKRPSDANGAWYQRRIGVISAIALATLLCFAAGIVGVRLRNQMRYQQQLRDLSVAVHLDAYLNANDIPLIEAISQMDQWRQAAAIAERLGEWNFSLAGMIDNASPQQREELLPTLSIEDQESVAAAWERFEKIAPADRLGVKDVAEYVANHNDPQALLKTMDRFARWRESLSAEERDQLTVGTLDERLGFIKQAIDRTVSQWTRQSGRALSDDDVDTIYSALRQLAKMRLETVVDDAPPGVSAIIESLMNNEQAYWEADFLARLFDINRDRYGRRDGPPPGSMSPTSMSPGSSSLGTPPPGPPSSEGFRGAGFPTAMIQLVQAIEPVKGPLRGDEIFLLESILPKSLYDMLTTMNDIPMLSEELMRNWIEESLRRTAWNRRGRSLLERYQSSDPIEREQIDLLPSEKILQELSEGHDRRR